MPSSQPYDLLDQDAVRNLYRALALPVPEELLEKKAGLRDTARSVRNWAQFHRGELVSAAAGGLAGSATAAVLAPKGRRLRTALAAGAGGAGIGYGVGAAERAIRSALEYYRLERERALFDRMQAYGKEVAAAAYGQALKDHGLTANGE